MAEKPILFSGPMVRAILDGRKTQTRRALKPQPDDVETAHAMLDTVRWKPGDALWVREKFSGPFVYETSEISPGRWPHDTKIWYWADGNPSDGIWTDPRPSIHMPRFASRITLRVTVVRVERLQDISEADAMAEGAPSGFLDEDGKFYKDDARGSYIAGFAGLWDQINGAGSWDANPWVAVIVFERVDEQ